MNGTRLSLRIDTPSVVHLLHVHGVGFVLEEIQYDPVGSVGKRSRWKHAFTPVTADTLGVTAPGAGGEDDATPLLTPAVGCVPGVTVSPCRVHNPW
jgi:hypothetical protein